MESRTPGCRLNVPAGGAVKIGAPLELTTEKYWFGLVDAWVNTASLNCASTVWKCRNQAPTTTCA